MVGARRESEGKTEGGLTSLMTKCQTNKGRRQGLYQHEVQTPGQKTYTENKQTKHSHFSRDENYVCISKSEKHHSHCTLHCRHANGVLNQHLPRGVAIFFHAKQSHFWLIIHQALIMSVICCSTWRITQNLL